MTEYFDIAITPTILDLQEKKGSRGRNIAPDGATPGDLHQLVTADGEVAAILVDYPSRTRLKLYGNAIYHSDPSPEPLESRIVELEDLLAAAEKS